MAQLPAAFNPQAPGQEGVGDFSAIDAGDYQAQIVASEMKATKAGTGSYLELRWNILAGDSAGRQLWTRLNLVNPSVQAVEIAQKHLKSLCDALGVPGPISDSQVLHGKPCMIRVAKTAATAQYPEGNEVKNYMPIGGAAPTGGTTIPGSPFPTQPTAPASVPVAPAPAEEHKFVAPGVPDTAPEAEAEAVPPKPPWLK
jgi:hypothetical protein